MSDESQDGKEGQHEDKRHTERRNSRKQERR